jgi:hypothetical protein
MCWNAIFDLYERDAQDFDRDRGRTLQAKAWLDRFLSHVRRPASFSTSGAAWPSLSRGTCLTPASTSWGLILRRP